MNNFVQPQILSLGSSLLDCVPRYGLLDKEICSFVSDEDKQRQLREFLQKLISPRYDFTDKSQLQISGDQDLSDLIQMGKYSVGADTFLKRHSDLPLSGDSGKYEYRLVGFDKPVNEKEFLEELHRDGFLTSSIRHLLVYGAMFPESDDCIVSTRLGNSIGGGLYYPAIFKDKKHDRRELISWKAYVLQNLQPVAGRFFLTVKKVS